MMGTKEGLKPTNCLPYCCSVVPVRTFRHLNKRLLLTRLGLLDLTDIAFGEGVTFISRDAISHLLIALTKHEDNN